MYETVFINNNNNKKNSFLYVNQNFEIKFFSFTLLFFFEREEITLYSKHETLHLALLIHIAEIETKFCRQQELQLQDYKY